MHTNKRIILDQEEFNVSHLHRMMRRLFSKKNDFATVQDLEEVAGELNRFGIITKKQLRLFLKKYRRSLIDFDKQPLDSFLQKMYREDLGDEKVRDAIRRRYWFAYPGLIRNAMEVEFGEEYEVFSNERDQI